MNDDDKRWAALDAAIGDLKAGISAETDDDAAYLDASRLTERLRQETNSCAGIRASIAERMRESGGLSLAKLANRIGVSKARADEMMRAAAARKESR